MSHHIPNDLLIEIFVRLPVKSLLRFTPVCKNWCSVIKNPDFIITHLNRFGKRSTDQLLVMMFGDREFLLLPNNENFDHNYVKLIFPCKVHPEVGQYLRIVGSCNGVICLYDTDKLVDVPKNIIIWNPCIRKSVTLPPPKITPSKCHIVIGCGFDLVKNMFKVVRIIYDREKKRKVPPEVEVHDQGKSEWRLIGRAPPHYTNVYLNYTSQVFFHGAVHWVAENRDTYSKIIVAFEIGDEVFREIAVPRGLPKACDLSISLYKDSITVFGGWSERFLSQIDECHVWMMRDYGVFESWTNLYKIVLPIVMSRPLGLRKNGKILFASKYNGIVSFNPETRINTKSSISGEVASSTVQNFVESLVLLT